MGCTGGGRPRSTWSQRDHGHHSTRRPKVETLPFISQPSLPGGVAAGYKPALRGSATMSTTPGAAMFELPGGWEWWNAAGYKRVAAAGDGRAPHGRSVTFATTARDALRSRCSRVFRNRPCQAELLRVINPRSEAAQPCPPRPARQCSNCRAAGNGGTLPDISGLQRPGTAALRMVAARPWPPQHATAQGRDAPIYFAPLPVWRSCCGL